MMEQLAWTRWPPFCSIELQSHDTFWVMAEGGSNNWCLGWQKRASGALPGCDNIHTSYRRCGPASWLLGTPRDAPISVGPESPGICHTRWIPVRPSVDNYGALSPQTNLAAWPSIWAPFSSAVQSMVWGPARRAWEPSILIRGVINGNL